MSAVQRGRMVVTKSGACLTAQRTPDGRIDVVWTYPDGHRAVGYTSDRAYTVGTDTGLDDGREAAETLAVALCAACEDSYVRWAGSVVNAALAAAEMETRQEG